MKVLLLAAKGADAGNGAVRAQPARRASGVDRDLHVHRNLEWIDVEPRVGIGHVGGAGTF